MKISTDGILTTHVGSLPRPVELEAKLLHRERRELDGSGRASLLGEVALAVADVVSIRRLLVSTSSMTAR
jgi:5-methyltetrahydropteroyltriglutamate--homocysteine methyltransferase